MGKAPINVVLFWFMNDWGMYGRAYEKIAENLSAQEAIQRVLCIMPPVRIRSGYGLLPFTFKKITKKLTILTPNLWVVPRKYNYGNIGKKINESTVPFALSKYFKLLSYNEGYTVLWVFPPHPFIYQLMTLLSHKFVVTQIVDNSTFKENHSVEEIGFARKQYDELANVSNMVITSSKLNFDYFSRLNPACYLFENAVDPVFLANPSNFPYLTNKKRPRLGYTGYISERTDIDLLIHLARLRPEYDLVLAGPVEIPTTEFQKALLPNVQYVGVVPYGKMPDFLRSLDICLIPHRDTQFSRSMSPLKMFQYMASGRPIVSTKVAGLDRWAHLISVAEGYDDFVMKIDQTITKDSIEQSKNRIQAARSETWDKRGREMVDALLGVINNG